MLAVMVTTAENGVNLSYGFVGYCEPPADG
jgi:hypothetical protein